MPFQRYVEIGRVAMVSYGAEYGKLVIITDVVDQNKALIDRPDEARRVINFKRLSITDFKIDIPRCAKKTVLKKAIEDSDVFNKFAASGWGKKIAKREARAAQNDLDRYKSTVAKIKRSAVVRRTVNKLKKAAK